MAKRACPARLRRILFEAAHLFEGLELGLNREVFYAPRGLRDLAVFDSAEPRESFGFLGQCTELTLNVAVVPGAGPAKIRSWVNGASTPEHGTHVDGVMAALKERRVQAVMVHVVMLHPAYAGPVRRQLAVPWVKDQIERMLQAPVVEWFPAPRC